MVFFFYEKITSMTEQQIIEALKTGQPFQGLPAVRVGSIVAQSRKDRFDVAFWVESGTNRVLVYGEIKSNCTPKTVTQIAPWLSRLKAVEPDAAFAIICPTLSPEAQSICVENSVDFIDLAGNISINVPGSKFVLQRLGRKGPRAAQPLKYPSPYGGRSSRVLRVLLQNPKDWKLTEIGEELAAESNRNAILQEMKFWTKTTEQILQEPAEDRTNAILKEGFEVSLASISKVLRSLEEDLQVRRRDSSIAVPEPGRLLLAWAQKYKERYRWRLRDSFTSSNLVGPDLRKITISLNEQMGTQAWAFTGTAATLLAAPFAEPGIIDVFICEKEGLGGNLRGGLKWPLTAADTTAMGLKPETAIGPFPDLRLIYPYDLGVFMYSRRVEGIPIVSDIQAFLDLFAKGGRDLKQADYLLEEVIEPRWEKK